MRDVDNMQQQVGLACLVEGAFERVYQVGRQLADKSYCVGKEERQIFHHDLSYGGVESGEEFVLGKDLALGEQVHNGALAHVGVADKGHTDESAAVLALSGLLLVYLGQAFFEQAHAAEDDTTVHLKLGFTRTTQSYRTFTATRARTTALALKVSPESLQTRQHVSILCQFHLCLGGSSLGAHGKDVENKRCAVENLYL